MVRLALAVIRSSPLAAKDPAQDPPPPYITWAATFAGAVDGAASFWSEGLRPLTAVDRDLVRAIDFGMFAWLVVPLLRALKWVNGYIGNYGWSIIVLTVLINIACSRCGTRAWCR